MWIGSPKWMRKGLSGPRNDINGTSHRQNLSRNLRIYIRLLARRSNAEVICLNLISEYPFHVEETIDMFNIQSLGFQKRVMYMLTEMRNKLDVVTKRCETLNTDPTVEQVSTMDELQMLEDEIKNITERQKLVSYLISAIYS